MYCTIINATDLYSYYYVLCITRSRRLPISIIVGGRFFMTYLREFEGKISKILKVLRTCGEPIHTKKIEQSVSLP
jgi:hypothetical protein